MLPGVKIFDLKKNIDGRGAFTEIFRSDWKIFEGDSIVQSNLSISYPGVIRAWHRHSKGQVDYICVIKGAIKACVYNDGKDSKTKGQLDEIILNSENPQIIRIPGEYWHGTMCIGKESSLVLYMVTKLYDYENPDEERKSLNDPSVLDSRTGKPYEWITPKDRNKI